MADVAQQAPSASIPQQTGPVTGQQPSPTSGNNDESSKGKRESVMIVPVFHDDPESESDEDEKKEGKQENGSNGPKEGSPGKEEKSAANGATAPKDGGAPNGQLSVPFDDMPAHFRKPSASEIFEKARQADLHIMIHDQSSHGAPASPGPGQLTPDPMRVVVDASALSLSVRLHRRTSAPVVVKPVASAAAAVAAGKTESSNGGEPKTPLEPKTPITPSDPATPTAASSAGQNGTPVFGPATAVSQPSPVITGQTGPVSPLPTGMPTVTMHFNRNSMLGSPNPNPNQRRGSRDFLTASPLSPVPVAAAAVATQAQASTGASNQTSGAAGVAILAANATMGAVQGAGAATTTPSATATQPLTTAQAQGQPMSPNPSSSNGPISQSLKDSLGNNKRSSTDAKKRTDSMGAEDDEVTSPGGTQEQGAGTPRVGLNKRRGSRVDAGPKVKCDYKNCMSFAVKGHYCLRHVWRENVQENKESVTNPKQYLVAMEILTTEKSYMEGLRVVVNSFLLRLRTLVEMQKPMISNDQIEAVFHNIEDLYNLSWKFTEDLDELRNERVMVSQIATTLMHYVPQFRLYQPYLENYDIAVRVIHQLRKSNPELDFFLRWTEKCEGQALDAFLVLPIQRLPRYQLLLAELKKSTPKDDPSYEDISEALSKIVNIADAINDSLHVKDAVEKVRAIAVLFDKDDRYIDLVTPNRVLVKEGLLKKKYSQGSRHLSGSKSYQFFLFNDILLYASVSKSWNKVSYKLKHWHSLLEVDLEPGGTLQVVKRGKEKDAALDIGVKCKGKSFTITCNDEAERNDWYGTLKDTIAKYKVASKELRVAKFDGSSKKNTVVGKSQKLAALTGT